MLVEFLFRKHRRCGKPHPSTGTCAEHWSTSGHHWGEIHESDFRHDIVVNGFHATTAQISFVPKARSTGILQELLPPFPVRSRARPPQQRLLIAPVLAHADVHREKRKDEIFVRQQSIRMGVDGGGNLRSESQEGSDSSNTVYAHAQVNDDEVWIARKINRSSLDASRHKKIADSSILHRHCRLPRRIKERHRRYLHIRLQPDRLNRDLHLQLRPQL
jgi:hypothetical protein